MAKDRNRKARRGNKPGPNPKGERKPGKPKPAGPRRRKATATE